MKIQLKESPERVELIKAMGSNNKLVAAEAQEAFAAFIAPVVQQVLNQAGTASMIYSDMPYNEDDAPSIPLDLYYGTDVGYITVWSQALPGGLPTSHVSGIQEMKIATYRLDSAVSLLKRYARRARLDVVSKAIERMSQEILVKQERNAWAVLLKALGEARTGGADHIICSGAADLLLLEDFSKLITLVKRLNKSFASGTSVETPFGLTDIFMSPEMTEQIRAFAYNPQNTTWGPKVTGSTLTAYTATTAVPLPDTIREQIFRAAGAMEIYGKTLHELQELGISQKYNTLFEAYAPASVAHGSSTFATATTELLVGLDLSRDVFKRPIARNAESGSTVTVEADDQWFKRSDKMGWYTSLEEGRVCLDGKAVVGLLV